MSDATNSQIEDIADPVGLPTTTHNINKRYSRLWIQGLWTDNPALVKLLGLCPLLAISNSVVNALALGIATTVTLLITNMSVSCLRNLII